MRLKLPYQKGAREGCRRLKETHEVWQMGMEAMRQAAEGPGDLESRLRDVLKIWRKTVESGRSFPPTKPWIEEDVFLWCADDLLLAMFADEARRLARASNSPESRGRATRYLLDVLYGIPRNDPRWNEGTRPRIEKEIKTILK